MHKGVRILQIHDLSRYFNLDIFFLAVTAMPLLGCRVLICKAQWIVVFLPQQLSSLKSGISLYGIK